MLLRDTALACQEVERERHGGRKPREDAQGTQSRVPHLGNDRKPHQDSPDGPPQPGADPFAEDKPRGQGDEDDGRVLKKECHTHGKVGDRDRVEPLNHREAADAQQCQGRKFAPCHGKMPPSREGEPHTRKDRGRDHAHQGHLCGIEARSNHHLGDRAVDAKESSGQQRVRGAADRGSEVIVRHGASVGPRRCMPLRGAARVQRCEALASAKTQRRFSWTPCRRPY